MWPPVIERRFNEHACYMTCITCKEFMTCSTPAGVVTGTPVYSCKLGTFVTRAKLAGQRLVTQASNSSMFKKSAVKICSAWRTSLRHSAECLAVDLSNSQVLLAVVSLCIVFIIAEQQYWPESWLNTLNCSSSLLKASHIGSISSRSNMKSSASSMLGVAECCCGSVQSS